MLHNNGTPQVDKPIDRDTLTAAAAEGELTKALLPLVYDDQENLAHTLASLHEAGSIDVLDTFSATALAEFNQHDFFTLMMVYVETLPKINADTKRVMATTAAIVDRGGEDLAANEPYRAFREWCADDAARPRSVLALIDSAPELHGRFTRFVLDAAAVHDVAHAFAKARQLSDHAEPTVKLGAISALATMDLTENPDEEEAVFATLRRQVDMAADPTVMANALGALIERCLASDEHRAATLQHIIDTRPETPLPIEQLVYARAIETHGTSLTPALLDRLFRRLRKLDRQHGRLVQHLDHALAQHRDILGVERISYELIAILHESGGAIGLDDFRSFRHALCSGQADTLRDRLLLEALRSGSLRSSHDIGSLVTEINDERTFVSLDFAALGLTDEEIVTICRRATVSLALSPRATLDVLLGALAAVGKDAATAVCELLFEPVGLNYPETVVSELNERKNGRPPVERTLITSAVRRIKAYLKALDRPREIVEIGPSTLERRVARRRQFRSMRDSQSRAHEQSVFAMFATRHDILYGNSVAMYTPTAAADHPATRQEMRLSTMSVSIEMPRLVTLDPTERLLAIHRFDEE